MMDAETKKAVRARLRRIAVRSGDERECKRRVEELVAVFGRYKRIREQSP